MNADVRGRFRKENGFDPIEIFGSRRDVASRRLFLDFRSQLAREMQQEWMAELEDIPCERTSLTSIWF